MSEINCGECALYHTDECQPDKCLPGYRRFVDPMGDVWGRCDCEKQGKILVLRTDPHGRKLRFKKLVCSECHAVWEETAERRKIKTGDVSSL